MKRITFDDRFYHTEYAISGKKTQLRKIHQSLDLLNSFILYDDPDIYINEYEPKKGFYVEIRKYGRGLSDFYVKPKFYKIDDWAAVSQSYEDVFKYPNLIPDNLKDELVKTNGYRNKMGVNPEYMPFVIHINDIKVQQLQDMTDKDCLAEGIQKSDDGKYYYNRVGYNDSQLFDTPQEAYASLSEYILKKDAWKKNLYTFVFDFEVHTVEELIVSKLSEQKPIDPDIQKIIDEHFFEML